MPEGTIIDIELRFVGAGGARVAQLAALQQIERRELHVDDEVVPFAGELGRGHHGLGILDGSREKTLQLVASNQEIGRSVRLVLFVMENRLMQNGHGFSHRRECLGHHSWIDDVGVTLRDAANRTERFQVSHHRFLEALAFFHDEAAEIGAGIVVGPVAVSFKTRLLAVEIQPIQQRIPQHVVSSPARAYPAFVQFRRLFARPELFLQRLRDLAFEYRRRGRFGDDLRGGDGVRGTVQIERGVTPQHL